MPPVLIQFVRSLRWMVPASLLAASLSCTKTLTPASASGIYADPQSLTSLINANFDLSHYDTSLILSGLDTVLAGKGPFTAFVVQDGAYPTAGTGFAGNTTYYSGGAFYGLTINSITNSFNYYYYAQKMNVRSLKKVVSYHILPMKLNISDIPTGMNNAYATLSGDSVYISKYSDPSSGRTVVTVNGIPILRQDLQASNGTYHVLSQLLFPPPNRTTWGVLAGSNALGWAFEPTFNLNPFTNPDSVITATTGYNYSLFAAALRRTGLDQLLKGSDSYTVLAVPDQYFLNVYYNPNPYAYNRGNMSFTAGQIDTMNIDTLTRMMKLHILKGRYFLSDFQSYPYNGNTKVTYKDPAWSNQSFTYSAPLAFPTIGTDSVYVIPHGKEFGSNGGLWLFGAGNLSFSVFWEANNSGSNIWNFAAPGTPNFMNGNAQSFLFPQDVVAPNGVIQFLTNIELIPK